MSSFWENLVNDKNFDIAENYEKDFLLGRFIISFS